ncbi:MAG: DUF3107 domain-containing protein [Longispora sp.]|nr:DUF3107 domain-containing protein [Longispora sp. (in: high G+C Gram-positive bacteria)]
MEVKIGVQFASRELILESTLTSEEVEKAVFEALSAKTKALSLEDDKGRRVIVPVEKLAYVEIAEQQVRVVGFTAS